MIVIYGLPPLPPTSDFVFLCFCNHVLMSAGIRICDLVFCVCGFVCLCLHVCVGFAFLCVVGLRDCTSVCLCVRCCGSCCGVWLVAFGFWLVSCGLWPWLVAVACSCGRGWARGLWLVACGMWLVACGLWLRLVAVAYGL
jgi:hypothetical protein